MGSATAAIMGLASDQLMRCVNLSQALCVPNILCHLPQWFPPLMLQCPGTPPLPPPLPPPPPPPPLLLLLLLLLLPVWTAGFSHTRSERTINTTFAWNASVLLATAKKLHEKYAPDFGHQSDNCRPRAPRGFCTRGSHSLVFDPPPCMVELCLLYLQSIQQ